MIQEECVSERFLHINAEAGGGEGMANILWHVGVGGCALCLGTKFSLCLLTALQTPHH